MNPLGDGLRLHLLHKKISEGHILAVLELFSNHTSSGELGSINTVAMRRAETKLTRFFRMIHVFRDVKSLGHCSRRM
jgi:hypothetical protein